MALCQHTNLLSYSLVVIVLLLTSGCKDEQKHQQSVPPPDPGLKIDFNKKKWRKKRGDDYVYRDAMVDAVLYSDTIRALPKSGILQLLGAPDRTNAEYDYYVIKKTRLGLWTLKSRTLVIKYAGDQVEWIKIHE